MTLMELYTWKTDGDTNDGDESDQGSRHLNPRRIIADDIIGKLTNVLNEYHVLVNDLGFHLALRYPTGSKQTPGVTRAPDRLLLGGSGNSQSRETRRRAER